MIPRPIRAIAVCLLSVSALQCGKRSRLVFIDGGAHLGESYTAFRKTNLYSRHSWDIVAIEANPKLIPRLPKAPRLRILNKAIWTADGKLDFHMESETSGANTLYRSRYPEGFGLTTIAVESFDFSQWVGQEFSTDDYVILSLDVEGAEFPVLTKMLQDGTLNRIDRLYVEFHPWLHPPERQAVKKSRELLREAEKLGIIVGVDSAEAIMRRGDWIDFLL